MNKNTLFHLKTWFTCSGWRCLFYYSSDTRRWRVDEVISQYFDTLRSSLISWAITTVTSSFGGVRGSPLTKYYHIWLDITWSETNCFLIAPKPKSDGWLEYLFTLGDVTIYKWASFKQGSATLLSMSQHVQHRMFSQLFSVKFNCAMISARDTNRN